MGITGTWEGWVPTATDLYLRGNNIANWFDSVSTPYLIFNSGEISGFKSGSTLDIRTKVAKNLSGFSKLNFQVRQKYSDTSYEISGGVFYAYLLNDYRSTDKGVTLGSVTLKTPAGSGTYTNTFSIPFTYNATGYLKFNKVQSTQNFNCAFEAIYRIWLT